MPWPSLLVHRLLRLPAIVVVVFHIPQLFLNDSNHSLEAWNLSSSGTASTILFFIWHASSWIRAPARYRLAAQHFVYQKYTASLNLWKFLWQFCFLLPCKLAYSLRSLSTFFLIVAADIFPILNISAISLKLIFFLGGEGGRGVAVIEQLYFSAKQYFFFWVHTKVRNEPKRVKTTYNKLKRSQTS